MKHIKYPKIHRLGKDENVGILDGPVLVQEKIDGANLSVWIAEDGEMRVGSRNQDVTDKEDGFRGAVKYVLTHKGIENYLRENPTHRLFGEWLVKHNIEYTADNWEHFYLFDIMLPDGSFLPWDIVEGVSELNDIRRPHVFAQGTFTNEEVNKWAGQSVLATKGEGVVIKPLWDFVNMFGDKNYAKIVTEEFKEINAITFGGNDKHCELYWEQYVSNKYMTVARVKKIMQKLESEIDERLDKKHTSRVVGTCYHDMLQEEIWEIAKKAQKIHFKALQRICHKKAQIMFHDLLEGNKLSVAYETQ